MDVCICEASVVGTQPRMFNVKIPLYSDAIGVLDNSVWRTVLLFCWRLTFSHESEFGVRKIWKENPGQLRNALRVVLHMRM